MERQILRSLLTNLNATRSKGRANRHAKANKTNSHYTQLNNVEKVKNKVKWCEVNTIKSTHACLLVHTTTVPYRYLRMQTQAHGQRYIFNATDEWQWIFNNMYVCVHVCGHENLYNCVIVCVCMSMVKGNDDKLNTFIARKTDTER